MPSSDRKLHPCIGVADDEQYWDVVAQRVARRAVLASRAAGWGALAERRLGWVAAAALVAIGAAALVLPVPSGTEPVAARGPIQSVLPEDPMGQRVLDASGPPPLASLLVLPARSGER